MGGHFRKDFYIFFVPRKSLLCEKRLKVSDRVFYYWHFYLNLSIRTSPFMYISYLNIAKFH